MITPDIVDKSSRPASRGSLARITAGAVFALAGLATASVSNGSPAPAGPVVKLETREHEFGSLLPGSPATATIKVSNPGREALDVRTIRTSSPNLTAELSPTTVAPGKNAALKLTLRSESWDAAGEFTTWVLLYSNDPATPLERLAVHGTIEAPVLRWGPKVPMLAALSRASQAIRLTRVEPKSDAPLGKLTATTSIPSVHADVVPDGDRAANILMRLDPDVPIGMLVGLVKVATGDPDFPEFDIPIRTQVEGNLRMNPYQFDFGIVDEGQPAAASVRLQVRTGKQVNILKTEAQLPVPVDLKVTPVDKGYIVDAKLSTASAHWSLGGHVTVFTDDPLQPVFEVPAVGFVRTARPFDRVAVDGDENGFYELAKAALFEDENIWPKARIVSDILGGVTDDRAASMMLRALKDENWYVRQRAVDVLGVLGNRSGVAPVRDAVSGDVQAEVRRAAIAALVTLDRNSAFPELLLALQDDDSFVRLDAAQLLGTLGDQRAIDPLKAATKDLEPEVRDAAKEALKQLGS